MIDNYIKGLRIDDSALAEDSYVLSIESFKNFDELLFTKPITFFVGENGSGKSTLLEAIAENYGFNREGGTKNYNFSTFDEKNDLARALVLYKGSKKKNYGYFFRAETFFNIASKEYEYANNPGSNVLSENYHEESHGEGFLHLFKNLSSSSGLYLLDEPEAALSYQRQLTFFSLMKECVDQGSQLIIVTHSPILLAYPDSDIYQFSKEGIKKIAYEETDSYKIMKSFIEHKDLMVAEMLK